MSAANRARRQTSVQQLAVQGLNFGWRRPAERSCGQSRADIPCEQGRVVAEAHVTQPRPGADVEPLIEVLPDGLSRGADVPANVPLRDYVVEMGLYGAQPAVDGFADVLVPRVSGSRPT